MTIRRTLLYGGMGLAGILVVALLGIVALWTIQAGEVLPNTTVAGVDVSGMDRAEVRTALDPLIESHRTEPVVFSFEDRTFTVVPADIGYAVDAESTVQAALSRGRQGLPGDILERVRSFGGAQNISLVDDYDLAAAGEWVDEVAEDVDRDSFPGSVDVDPDTLEVTVEMPAGRAEVRRGEAVDTLIDALLHPGSDRIELPVDTEPQRVPDEDVQAVAAQVERAVAAPLTMTSRDEELVLQPADLARIIDVADRPQGEGATLELVVSGDDLLEVLEEEDVAERFAREPRNAHYVTDRAPPVRFDDRDSGSFEPVDADVEVEPGRNGTRFDAELVAEQITQLLRAGDRGGDLRLEEIEAEFSTARAEQLRPTHLIGTFTTYHPSGQTRVVNIQKLADEIDGAMVEPGGQFSINEISGRRTCESGYRPAGTIVGGELTDTCGGGTSQFGTTTFNAAFFAGVQLDQWKAHSWYFSRYPMGREATLSYPQLDVKFTNNTDGAILVRTSYTSGSITVSLYGQPIASRVTASHGSPTNHTSAETIRRNTNELYEGQTRVEQSGFGGFTVEVVRTIDLIEGGEETQTIRTVYVPQDRIVEVGTRSRPEPEDEPEEPEEPDDPEAEDPSDDTADAQEA